MVMRKILTLAFAAFVVSACVGCPDYTHLREVPDYENMTDSGAEPGVPDEEAEEQ